MLKIHAYFEMLLFLCSFTDATLKEWWQKTENSGHGFLGDAVNVFDRERAIELELKRQSAS